MKFEILDSLPTTGPMYIPVTGDGQPFYSQGFVVRFYKSDGSNWVANFQLGIGGHSGVYSLQDENKFAVFSYGTCYIMTPDNTRPLDCFNVGVQEVLISKQRQIIAISFTDISVIEPDGRHSYSERISWDGFKDIHLDGDILSGLSYDPANERQEWVPFTFNINSKVITGGSYRQYEFTRVEKGSEQLKNEKPWWKFWD